MFHNNVVYVFVVSCWLCSMGVQMTNSQSKDSVSDVDCSQFSNDYDVLQQFPFPVLIDPIEPTYRQSLVNMDKNNTFVQEIYIYREEVVPSGLFCLSNLEILNILETPFQDGIVPDALGNLKQLQEIFIYNSRIIKLTEKLVTLPNISILLFDNCSLNHIQNLTKLDKLWGLELPNNNLSHIDGIPAVQLLRLDGNLFKEIPTTKDKDKLRHLLMRDNPLRNALPILSYKNLEQIYLENTTLTSIPSTIDKLQKIKHLYLGHNKISYLPTNVLNLPHLEELSLSNNLFSPNDIKSIQKAFKKSHPNLDIYI